MARKRTSALNCLIAVDKPVGITSHDMVSRVRRLVGERRVGHAGTLDPLASGVMVVGIGQATRLLGRLTLDEKSYVARIAFGAETATDDAEGEITTEAPVDERLFDPAFASQLLEGFLGPQMQVPPAYSAIQVAGKRAYRAARAGDAIDLPARPVDVKGAQLIGIAVGDEAAAPADGDAPEGRGSRFACKLAWDVAFTVSKGTYIRALARDIGRAAGSAAHVSALRRTSSGTVTLARCVPEEALPGLDESAWALDPLAALGIPRADLPEDARADVLCGRAVPRRRFARATFDTQEAFAEDARAGVVVGGRLQALAWYDGGALRMKDVFPEGVGGIR